MEYKKYRRTNVSEMTEWNENDMFPSNISISEVDKANGSPKVGDMIARNPNNHNDMWLVAEKYFKENFEEIVK